jgi:DNA modification methylase
VSVALTPRTERVPISRLHPAPWNPRILRDARFKSLCASLQADPEFLDLRPILATADGTVYGGNQRLRAAMHLGWIEVPAIIADIPERLARERARKDNNNWGEWQEDDLAALVYDLGQQGADLAALGFDDKELTRLLDSVGALGDDAIPEPPAAPITRPGDLWLLGPHRLLCGDATRPEDVARLMGDARPALMVTDPPYGVEYEPEWRQDRAEKGQLAYAARRVGPVTNDGRFDWREAWALSPAAVVYCWTSGLHASDVDMSLREASYEVRAEIIWVKPHFPISRGHYHWRHESCWYAVRGGASAGWMGDERQTTVWEIALDPNAEGGHSTQKPVECMARPLRNHAGDVYDPFLGSGTTLVAAHTLGRACYGMEIEPPYCDVAVQRWEHLTGDSARREASV